MTSCNIFFENNPQCIYHTGDNVTGYVELKNEKVLTIKCITLRIEGFAKCKWNEVSHAGTSPLIMEYKGKEEFINVVNYVMGDAKSENIELAEGTYQFKFNQKISSELPTSVESKYGNIRYQIKVEIERQRGSDLKFCFPFTVIKQEDLSKRKELNMPQIKGDSKKLLLGLSSKKLTINAEIPFSGYVSGQIIVVNSTINNQSNADVIEVLIQLFKIIKYKSNKSFIFKPATKIRKEKIVSTKHQGVAANSSCNVKASLIIPTVPPTNVDSCETVKVFYEIHVTAKSSGVHRDLSVVLPITIGTIPLALNYNDSASSSQPSTSQGTRSNLKIFIPPPTYEEAVMTPCDDADDENNEGLNDDVPYSPMYPRFYGTHNDGDTLDTNLIFKSKEETEL